MKEITWAELKELPLSEIKEGQCLKVTGDGEMSFYVIVKPEGEMRIRIEGIISQIDSSRGF
ncbi:MAG: hypothetical protein MUO99_01910 [Dehalococcoidales bacterium]|nr:hypothetical protein [Dehalococcoidales bacterium]